MAGSAAVAAPSKLTMVLRFERFPVASLAEARAKVADYVKTHGMVAETYGDVCGRIWRDDKPYARVSVHGRLWMLDARGNETYREMNDAGEVAP